MKIQLIESEIKEALQQYLGGVVSISNDKEFNIEILATRGATGVTAEVTIEAKSNKTEEKKEEVKVEVKEETNSVFASAPVEEVKPVAEKKSFFANM